jgi:hypothetical protein
VTKGEKGDSEIKAAYYAHHDLREIFSRDNANRRREAGHTLRRLLSDKQDRQMLSVFVKIRDEYEIMNNSDAVVVWAQQQIAAGNEKDLDPELVEVAKRVTIPRRADAPVPKPPSPAAQRAASPRPPVERKTAGTNGAGPTHADVASGAAQDPAADADSEE